MDFRTWYIVVERHFQERRFLFVFSQPHSSWELLAGPTAHFRWSLTAVLMIVSNLMDFDSCQNWPEKNSLQAASSTHKDPIRVHVIQLLFFNGQEEIFAAVQFPLQGLIIEEGQLKERSNCMPWCAVGPFSHSHKLLTLVLTS